MNYQVSRQFLILLLVTLLGSLPATAELDFLGSYSYGSVGPVSTHGDVVYFGSSATLMIARIGRDGDLVITKEIEFPNFVWNIHQYENFLYASVHDRVHVFDISTPSNPLLLAEFPSPSLFTSFVSGSIWYSVVNQSSTKSVALFDLQSTPTSPQEVGRWEVDNQPFSLAVRDEILYAAANLNSTSTLYVVDFSEPSTPFTINTLENLPKLQQIFLRDDYLYLSTYESSLIIMDISDPSNPVQVGQMTLDQPSTFSVEGNRGIMVSGEQISSLGFSDPLQPKILDTVTLPHPSSLPLLMGNTFYVPLNSKGMAIGQIDLKGTINMTDHYQAPGIGGGIDVQENFAYVTGQDQLTVFDVSDSRNPTVLGSLPLPERSFAIAIDGSLGVVSTGGQGDDVFQLHIIDLNDHDSLKLISSVELVEWPTRIRLRDGYAYIAGRQGGFVILNLLDPKQPVEVATFDSFATDVFLQGGFAYVVDIDAGRIMIIDISDPNAPTYLSEYNPPSLFSIGFTMLRNFGYIMNGGFIEVVDFQNLENPVWVATIASQFYNYLPVIEGTILYSSAGGGAGIRSFDLTDPRRPTEIGTMTNLMGSVVAVGNSRVYASSGWGLFIFRDLASPTFSDGFESGDFSQWSEVQP